MSATTAALSALAELRKASAEASSRELARAEAALLAALEQLAHAEDAFRREQATCRALSVAEARLLARGGARVADVLRQQAYLGRLERELAKLCRLRDDARRAVAQAREVKCNARQSLAGAWGDQRAAEQRLNELLRDETRCAERSQEEDAEGNVIARWSGAGSEP